MLPRLSRTFMVFPNGSVPTMYGSKILFLAFEANPVLGSILTKLIPEGTLNGTLFLLIFNFAAKFLKIGTATDEPVCL